VTFVDTGAFLALYRRRDQHQLEARRIWKKLRDQQLVTSNHVLAELATLLGRAVGFAEAADRVQDIYKSPSIQIVSSTTQVELSSLVWIRKFSDHEISFTDCTSFTIMKQEGIRVAFTFDRHFREAGFEVIGLS
jgi:uncharacterized protein